MRLAIVADWLTTYGGAEHVIARMLRLWPDATVFTTVARRGKLGPLQGADIRTTPLQRWYDLIGVHQVLLPWMPQAIEGIDLSGFDVVLSSSHAVAKGVLPPATAAHVCYCHTPMRYAWEMEDIYLKDFRVPGFLRKRVKRQLKRLRRWDLSTAKRVDAFVANSTETQRRIERTYGREAAVVPPPVDERFFETPAAARSERYFLAVGRLVPYKRFDLLIEAANARSLPLWIAGTGQDEARLRRMAGPTVRLLGFVPEDDLPGLYAGAEALLFPQYEDAGMVLLEAMACGTPGVAYRKGGACDAVAEGVTGAFIEEQTAAGVLAALETFGTMHLDRTAIRAHARRFSTERFDADLRRCVEEARQRVLAARGADDGASA